MDVKIRKKYFHENVYYSHKDGSYIYKDALPTIVRRSFYAIVVDGKTYDTALTKSKAVKRVKIIKRKSNAQPAGDSTQKNARKDNH